MLDLSDGELQWVIKHLGHSMDVHMHYYRNIQSTIEKAKIAKLLILSEKGDFSKFVGRQLESIDLEGTWQSLN